MQVSQHFHYFLTFKRYPYTQYFLICSIFAAIRVRSFFIYAYNGIHIPYMIERYHLYILHYYYIKCTCRWCVILCLGFPWIVAHRCWLLLLSIVSCKDTKLCQDEKKAKIKMCANGSFETRSYEWIETLLPITYACVMNSGCLHEQTFFQCYWISMLISRLEDRSCKKALVILYADIQCKEEQRKQW